MKPKENRSNRANKLKKTPLMKKEANSDAVKEVNKLF